MWAAGESQVRDPTLTARNFDLSNCLQTGVFIVRSPTGEGLAAARGGGWPGFFIRFPTVMADHPENTSRPAGERGRDGSLRDNEHDGGI